jgi:hypothetical protein
MLLEGERRSEARDFETNHDLVGITATAGIDVSDFLENVGRVRLLAETASAGKIRRKVKRSFRIKRSEEIRVCDGGYCKTK